MEIYYISSRMTPYAGQAWFSKLQSIRQIASKICKRFDASSMREKDFAILKIAILSYLLK